MALCAEGKIAYHSLISKKDAYSLSVLFHAAVACLGARSYWAVGMLKRDADESVRSDTLALLRSTPATKARTRTE